MKKIFILISIILLFISGVAFSENLTYLGSGGATLRIEYSEDIELESIEQALIFLAGEINFISSKRLVEVKFYDEIHVGSKEAFGTTYKQTDTHFRAEFIKHSKAIKETELYGIAFPKLETVEAIYKSTFVHELTHVFLFDKIEGRVRNEYVAYALQLKSMGENIRSKTFYLCRPTKRYLRMITKTANFCLQVYIVPI